MVKLGSSLTAVRIWCSGSDDGVVARDGGQGMVVKSWFSGVGSQKVHGQGMVVKRWWPGGADHELLNMATS